MKQILTLSLIAGLLFACGSEEEKAKENPDLIDNISSLTKMGENIEKQSKELEDRGLERKKRGDTVAMHYDKLKGYLPSNLSGFEPTGEPKGEIVKMAGMSFSQIEQKYKKGDAQLDVKLADYNGAASVFALASAMMSSGFMVENDEELTKGWDAGIKDVKGWESFKKKQKEVSVMLTCGGRFMLTVSADKQDNSEEIKTIAKSANWAELSKY